ncbi:MAG TPA: sulfite exporter TauE/SafE family protein [Candidatus Fimenecus excrementigallinarum]|uniref:Probable membrane transporter protein n=1 Tax=Candidatus Fimenecus excrementigallinarum TaxID=2840816 RepID=A0A9D1LDM5_9FIRM|nr:sulfite exporter TauE/SafE family protein [Candidatus Fimenecus excrementigallinarum]
MQTVLLALAGGAVGLVNVLIGAGGGILAVPVLKRTGLDQKQAQANAVAVILPLTALSFIIYAKSEYVNLAGSLWILPAAAVGALLGTLVFRKLSGKAMRRIFGLFMVWAGVRLLWKG